MRSNDCESAGKRTDGRATVPSAFVLTTEKAAMLIRLALAAGIRVKAYSSDATPVALCNVVLKLIIYPPILSY